MTGPASARGLLVAVLILAPESMTAVRAALAIGAVHLPLFLAHLMLMVET